MRAVGSPRVPTDRRGIAVASALDSPMPCHAVARRSHGDLNERRGNAVGSPQQRNNSAVSLLKRREDAVCTQQGRRKNDVVGGGACAESSRSLWRRHGVFTASSQRVYGVCIASTSNIIYPIVGRLQGVDTAATVRCELPFTKENIIQATYMKVWHQLEISDADTNRFLNIFIKKTT